MSDADFTQYKRCTKCESEKPFADFYKDARGKHGLRSVCKVCFCADNQKPGKKEYKADWYQANKGRILDAYKTSPEVKQYRKEYRAKNSKKLADQVREWRANLTPEQKARIAAESEARGKRWREQNPERAMAILRNRRARVRNAEGSHTAEDIRALLALQRRTCAVCRKPLPKTYHVDHVEPLAKGGSNRKDNLQILCPPCNLSKHARDPIEFMQSRGFLL